MVSTPFSDEQCIRGHSLIDSCFTVHISIFSLSGQPCKARRLIEGHRADTTDFEQWQKRLFAFGVVLE